MEQGLAENRKRTTINELITEILEICPRAQYVGYTATPFANVFIDPDDERDLFPADFVLSLHRPPDYMGVQEFHDVGKRWDDEERPSRTPTNWPMSRRSSAIPTSTPPASTPNFRRRSTRGC